MITNTDIMHWYTADSRRVYDFVPTHFTPVNLPSITDEIMHYITENLVGRYSLMLSGSKPLLAFEDPEEALMVTLTFA